MTNQRSLDNRCIDTLRFLAADAIQAANSGHPGLPLGAAPMAHVLWTRHLHHNPEDPSWFDRDRFVLSAGHGSALLYALLHLAGYDLGIEDLRAFRQWESRTPGHPESHMTPGVEVTTGPLGQGIANAVGMAIAERQLAATHNREGHEIIDHYTYALAGDGDLMEGVCYEACALAGHLRLGKLIVLFDSNGISLAGSTSLSTSEDTAARFAAAGWHVAAVEDGTDLDAIDAAIEAAKTESGRPSLIAVRTIIGQGAPNKQGTHKVHGSPLGEDEIEAAKSAVGWPSEPRFLVPEDVRAFYRTLEVTGSARQSAWTDRLSSYARAFPKQAAELDRRIAGRLPEAWTAGLPSFETDSKGMATRKASETVLQEIAKALPELVGGSADLNPSTFTWLKGAGDFQAAPSAEGVLGAVGGPWGYQGRNIHFGIREHAMGAVANGMAAHGGFAPYTATFLVFADYMRPPIRLAALSGYPTTFVFTHDSVAVGEDGPTHQPVEQIMSLRLIPDLVVVRPADANETVAAWRVAMERRGGPTVLVFSRQNVPTLDRSALAAASGLECGGYVLWESSDRPQVILIGTGAETHAALEAGRRLAHDGVAVRVVSLPSWELFEAQDEAYREHVLPANVSARVAIEAGVTAGWERYVGSRDAVVGVDRFGASAPGDEVLRRFGLTADAIVERARKSLAG